MTVSLLNIAFVAFVSALLWQIVSKILYKSSPYPLPPGPPGEPVLGHLRVIPFEDPATTYQKWGEEYGSDVLYFKTLGQPFIVLNSVKSAVELLDKRGSNYCDRPRFVLLELLGWGMTLTFLRWGPKMKLHRQILQSPFTKPNVVQYKDLQLAEAHQAVKNIMQKPSTWELSLKRFAVAIVLNVAYGVEVTTDDDPYIKIAEDASYATGHSGAPAGTVVDRIPAVKFLPSWLPGLECLKFAEDWRWAIETIHEVPFKAALERMEEGKLDKSFIHTHLEKFNKNAEKGLANDFDLADIKGAAGAIYIAGGDTTMTTLIIFVAVMMIYPDVQKKAQAEVDTIVGSERLPDFDDLPNLPYITNLIQELYRYNPLSPLGIPHRSIEDDVYNGMFIPAGTIIYQNVRAMTLDPEVYSDPETFNPDRYIPKDEGGKGEPFPIGNFGFGRRVCVGRHLASNSIFIVVATILATMNIRYPSGPDGKEEKFEIQWSKIGTAHPLPFPSAMTPRSKVAEQLIFNSV